MTTEVDEALGLVQGISVHTAPPPPLFSQPKHTAQWALVRDYLD
mgnify:CR=1 FL=1